MKTGALIFAQNNSSIDYVKMAAFAAKKLQHHLKIPVSIVTNSKNWLLQSQPDNVFDEIIEIADAPIDNYRRFNDGSLASKISDWKNYDRSTVYDLSPYDTTLVIDSDYIINSNFLAPLLRKDDDLQLFKTSCDISSWRSNNEYTNITPYSVEFYWATVFIFKKNNLTNSFFKLITYIKENWNYFTTLYGITSPVYRNDFAFSIAIHMMNGNQKGSFATTIPGNICYITDRDLLVSIKDTSMQFLIEKQNYLGEYTIAKTADMDIHVMNKASLNRFIDGGSGV